MFELLNAHDQDIKLDHLVEILKQSALSNIRNPSLSRRRGSWRFWSWLKLASAVPGHSVCPVNSEQQLNKNYELRSLLCRNSQRERTLWSRQNSVFDSFKTSTGDRASPSVVLDSGCDDPHTRMQFKRKCLLLKLSFFFANFYKCEYIIFHGSNRK
jgi:hypothetical protein